MCSSMTANEPGKMVVRTRDVMATLGLVLWCVHLAFNAEKLITHFVCRERGGGGGGRGGDI